MCQHCTWTELDISSWIPIHNHHRCPVTSNIPCLSSPPPPPPPDSESWRTSTVVVPVVHVWRSTAPQSFNLSPFSEALTSSGSNGRLQIHNMRCYEKWNCCTRIIRACKLSSDGKVFSLRSTVQLHSPCVVLTCEAVWGHSDQVDKCTTLNCLCKIMASDVFLPSDSNFVPSLPPHLPICPSPHFPFFFNLL